MHFLFVSLFSLPSTPASYHHSTYLHISTGLCSCNIQKLNINYVMSVYSLLSLRYSCALLLSARLFSNGFVIAVLALNLLALSALQHIDSSLLLSWHCKLWKRHLFLFLLTECKGLLSYTSCIALYFFECP